MTYSLICFASVNPAQAVTLFMWKCCYDVLCEWWSFYRSPAANSFHPPNLRWLMPRLLFFFPHGLVPPCVISERRVCFWFNFQITCMWEHCCTSHVSLKIQLGVYISVQAGNHVSSLSWILYGYTLRWHASIRKSVWLKAGVYSNLDASARAVFQHDS